MRRSDREKDAASALAVFRDCSYATLATANPDGSPYCTPICVVLLDGCIYFHGAKEGKKLDNIKRNSNVCISAVSLAEPLPQKFSMKYDRNYNRQRQLGKIFLQKWQLTTRYTLHHINSREMWACRQCNIYRCVYKTACPHPITKNV